MARQRPMLYLIGMSTLVLASVYCWGATPRAETPGETLYKAKCAVCHGVDGKGETPVGKLYKLRDLCSADAQKQSDADMTKLIVKGKNKMPAYGRSLKEDQIKNLVTYIRSLAKKS